MRPSAASAAGLITLGLVLLGAGLTFAAAAASAPVDAATVSLAACGGVLVYALRSLFALVRALMRPDELAQAGRGAGLISRIELRASKELEFDHGMGKLSQEGRRRSDSSACAASSPWTASATLRLSGVTSSEASPDHRSARRRSPGRRGGKPAIFAPATRLVKSQKTRLAPSVGRAPRNR